MKWIAFVGAREIGDVEAPDKEVAQARARARWGPAVDRVVSRVEHEIQQEEYQARDRANRRRVQEVEDDDGA